MNDLESLLTRIKTFNGKAQAAHDGMTALLAERQAIICDAAALGLKYRKTVPMLAAISFDIAVPGEAAEVPDQTATTQAAE